MNKYTVEVDGKVFDFYQDTPPTDDEILSAVNGDELKVDVYAEQPKKEAQPEKKQQNIGKFKDKKELTGWSGDITALYSNAVDWFGYGIPDLVMKYLDPEELEAWDAARKANPAYATGGIVAGVGLNALTTRGLGLAGYFGKTAMKGLASKVGANEAVQNFIGRAGKRVGEGVGLTVLEDTHKTLDAIEKTEDFNKALDAWDGFGKDTAFNSALGVLMGDIAAPVLKYTFSPTYRALVMVGKDARTAGRAAFIEALKNGKTPETAVLAGKMAIFQNMPENTVKKLATLAGRDENFSRGLTELIVGKGLQDSVVNTQAALTAAQTAEYSKNFNQALYGKGYRNQLGATSPDFSLDGLLHSMGIRMGTNGKMEFTEQASLAREQAKNAAQQHINTQIRLGGVWKGRTEMQYLGQELQRLLGPDYGKFLTKMAQNRMNLAYRKTPEATQIAEARLKADIYDIATEMSKKGGNKMPPEAYEQAAAEKYIDNMISYGTDDVYMIDALGNTIESAFPKQVEEGLGSVLGRYSERLNTNILDNPEMVGENARGLYWTNQSYRWTQKVRETYNKAMDFHGTSKNAVTKAEREAETAELNSLNEFLNQGTDVKDTIIRKAIFKGAMANRFLQASKNGNFDEAIRIKSWITGNGDLVGKAKVFRPGEFDDYYNMMKPEIEAARKINLLVSASTRDALASNPNIGEAAAKGIGAVATSGVTSNAVRISLQSIWNVFKFGGPETAKKVTQYLENPSWENFNAMLDSPKDTTTKNFMRMMVDKAIQDAANYLAIEAETGMGLGAGMSMATVDSRSK